MQLEPELRALASEIDWPPTPTLRPQFEPPRRGLPRPLLAIVALTTTALAVALAVPQSRAAILRFIHLGAATVQLVQRLPTAQERPLAAELGATIPATTARAALHGHLLLPPLTPLPPLHKTNSFVSMVFRYHGAAVLLSEVFDRDGIFLKKAAGPATHIVPTHVGRSAGLWLSGAAHVFLFPNTPPRLAHNVLLWHQGQITLRLEGQHLTEATANTLARSLTRTR